MDNKYLISQTYELIDAAAFVNVKVDLQHPPVDPQQPEYSVYNGIVKQEFIADNQKYRMLSYIPENYIPAGMMIMVLMDNGVKSESFLVNSHYRQCADKHGAVLLMIESPEGGWRPDQISIAVQYIDAAYAKVNLREYYGFQESSVSCLGIGAGAYVAMAYSLFRAERIASCGTVGRIGFHADLLDQLNELYTQKLEKSISNQPLAIRMVDYSQEDEKLIAFLQRFYCSKKFIDEDGDVFYFSKNMTGFNWMGYEACESLCLASKNTEEKMCEFLATYKRFFADNMGRLMITRSVKDMGLIHCEKVINGKRRHWLLYIPSSYKTGKKKSFPLVMAIPGYSCNDWYLAQISDWHVVGEKRDFFVVYPCAFPGSTPSGCVPLPMWKSGEMYPNDREDNEIFLKKVVEDTCEKYPIDQSRIFVSGHSNGSKMTQELLCAYPGLFTAAAPIGFVCGELGTNLLRNIPDNVGPIWYIKGENDIGIACDMDENLANQGMINILCKINHVSEKPVIYRNGKYESLIYYNENHVPVVKFTKVIDMPHAQTPEMSLMIWDEFFSRFRRMPGGTVSYVW